jgi:hypothetical protein
MHAIKNDEIDDRVKAPIIRLFTNLWVDKSGDHQIRYSMMYRDYRDVKNNILEFQCDIEVQNELFEYILQTIQFELMNKTSLDELTNFDEEFIRMCKYLIKNGMF